MAISSHCKAWPPHATVADMILYSEQVLGPEARTVGMTVVQVVEGVSRRFSKLPGEEMAAWLARVSHLHSQNQGREAAHTLIDQMRFGPLS